MTLPVLIVASGGLPVTEVTSGGLPVSVVLADFGGLPVTIVASGGLPVVGSGLPTAPVLTITSASSDDTPEFTIDIDNTVTAGDSIRLQIQVAGGDWSSLVSDTTHDITAPEDAANEINLALAALANGNYEARCNVTDGVLTSNWSNTVSFTISGATGNTAVFISHAQY